MEKHPQNVFFPRVSPWLVAFFLLLGLVSVAICIAFCCWRKQTEKEEQHESALLALKKELAEKQEQHESALLALKKELEYRKVCSYSTDVTLDPNTAHPELILSEDLKSVIHGGELQPVLDSRERFDLCACVLGSEGFTSGRHYWEVEVDDKIEWTLGAATVSINRKGWITPTPENGYWTVWLRNETEYMALSSPRTNLTLSVKPRKIGVYLDYEGGRVSFYNVDDKSLIYTFNDEFTEKMFPFFSPSFRKMGKNDKPLRIYSITVWE
nr:PREDICTED: zinc-binding protein A33-like [Latimeria chalumnae]|eukprot:XP_014352010.1 PREDICTED: zinc-binding protein A33-like [Latimeria chalumnae]